MSGGTVLPGGVPNTVPGALARAIERFGPDHVALRDDLGAVTLGELAGGVARAVGALHGFGVRPGDRVAASLPNGRAIAELFLATQCAGIIWVGVHESLVGPERAELLGDCTPALCVGPDGVGAEAWRAACDAAPAADPGAAGVDPYAVGAIAYTSGTTGRPKGVLHSQHNLLVPAASFAFSGRMVPDQCVGVAFPVTILNLMMQAVLGPLVAGATTCLLTRRDAVGMLEQIAAHEVELISIVPTSAFDIVRLRPEERAGVRSLQRVVVGGSHVGPELAADLARSLGVVVEHGYGLTEAPGLVSLGVVGDPLTAGMALPHITIEVRDESDRAVVGEEGEVVLAPRPSGPWAGVWRPPLGYWGRDDVPAGHPRELRTADQGILEETGALTILDRRSELILRGGSNVYPAEVERALAEHPAVDGVVVIGRPDGRLGAVPVAVVTLRDGVAPSAAELVSYGRGRLAAYKVPEVVIVPTLKRNALGKPDRAWARAVAADDRNGEGSR
jgi:long-chain acyl-CoA synthetase